MDYFVFSKGLYRNIPPLVVGISYWDWWAVWSALAQGVPVVDCTAYVTAVHQNHGYAPHPDGKGGTHLGPLAMQNYRLAGGLALPLDGRCHASPFPQWPYIQKSATPSV